MCRAHGKLYFPLRQEFESLMEESKFVDMTVIYTVDEDGTQISNDSYSSKIQDILVDKIEALFYICGPRAFASDTLNILQALGIDRNNVKIGAFGPEYAEENAD